MAVQDLRKSDMMSHLLNSLEAGKDIGHYGRLVFTIVGRHFMGEEELVEYLKKNPGVSEADARSLVMQVHAHGYNPPKGEKIREWQKQQEFPICPTNDPDACDVYKDLQFPHEVYERIGEYYHQKTEG
jgi:uncharacterized protein YneF (UPF0154 family)